MDTGIYQIRNLKDGKLYIGSAAQSFKQRWAVHTSLLLRNKHQNSYLQNAWNKHGKDVFVFEILLYCDPGECLVFEQIALDAIKPEYNINPCAASRLGVKLSETTKKKISQSHMGKTCSAATIERLRTARCGAKNSDYQKQRASEANRGENAHCAKLTKDQVIEIRALIGSITQTAIAKKFDVSDAVISNIKNRKTWRYV